MKEDIKEFMENFICLLIIMVVLLLSFLFLCTVICFGAWVCNKLARG